MPPTATKLLKFGDDSLMYLNCSTQVNRVMLYQVMKIHCLLQIAMLDVEMQKDERCQNTNGGQGEHQGDYRAGQGDLLKHLSCTIHGYMAYTYSIHITGSHF